MPVTTYTTINGVIVHEDRNGVQRNYRPDTLGNTIALTDATTTTDTMTYWPYGEIRTRTGTNATRFLYVGTLGYSKDGGSGILTYVRARYYNALRGRWATVDPLWPDESAYSYVKAMPVGATDSRGLGQDEDGSFMSTDCPRPLATDLSNAYAAMRLKLHRICSSSDKGQKRKRAYIECLLRNGYTTKQANGTQKCLCDIALGRLKTTITCRSQAFCDKFQLENCLGAETNSRPCKIDIADPSTGCRVPGDLAAALSHEVAHCCGASHDAKVGPSVGVADKCLREAIGWGWGS